MNTQHTIFTLHLEGQAAVDLLAGYNSRTQLAAEHEALKATVAQEIRAATQAVASAMATNHADLALINALMLLDDGLVPAESVVLAMRHACNLGTPAVPSMQRLTRVSSELFRVQTPGEAAAPAVGG